MANLLQFGGKKFTFSNVNKHREHNWQTSVKKLKKNAPFEWKILLRFSINMAQINEWHVRIRVRSKINVREKKEYSLGHSFSFIEHLKKYCNCANWKLGTNCSNEL